MCHSAACRSLACNHLHTCIVTEPCVFPHACQPIFRLPGLLPVPSCSSVPLLHQRNQLCGSGPGLTLYPCARLLQASSQCSSRR